MQTLPHLPLHFGVSFDPATGQWSVTTGNGEVDALPYIDTAWRPGDVLPGYDVVGNGGDVYSYQRVADIAANPVPLGLEQLPDSFQITADGGAALPDAALPQDIGSPAQVGPDAETVTDTGSTADPVSTEPGSVAPRFAFAREAAGPAPRAQAGGEPLNAGVSFDTDSGRWTIVNSDGVPVSPLYVDTAWRPGQALAGYETSQSTLGIYTYRRASGPSADPVPLGLEQLPASFRLTHTGEAWPSFDWTVPEIGATRQAIVDTSVDGTPTTVTFDIPDRHLLTYDRATGLAVYKISDNDIFDGIKVVIDLHEYVDAAGQRIAREPTSAPIKTTI